jgi:hypothetical protein
MRTVVRIPPRLIVLVLFGTLLRIIITSCWHEPTVFWEQQPRQSEVRPARHPDRDPELAVVVAEPFAPERVGRECARGPPEGLPRRGVAEVVVRREGEAEHAAEPGEQLLRVFAGREGLWTARLERGGKRGTRRVEALTGWTDSRAQSCAVVPDDL